MRLNSLKISDIICLKNIIKIIKLLILDMNLIKIKWIVECDIELVFLYLQSNFFNMAMADNI